MPVRTTTPVAQEDEHEALPEPEHDKPLFTDEARFRISFFLHKSIKKASRLALTEDIEVRAASTFLCLAPDNCDSSEPWRMRC